MSNRRRRIIINRWMTTAALGGGSTTTILLSGGTIAEDASVGSLVGALSVANGSGSYTFSITADPDSKFAIDGSNLETDATLDYETATSHSVTIEADNGIDDPISQVFIIQVTNVIDDEDAPAILSLSPADNATNVAIAAPLIIQFDKPIAFGDTVLIRLYNADGDVLVQEWTEEDVLGAMLDGDSLEILPDELDNSVDYYVTIASGSIESVDGVPFGGIANETTWNFTTVAGADVTAPTISSLSPLDNATDVAINSSLVATFSENIQFASSFDIELRLVSDNSVVELFDETDVGGTISISGDALTINPTSDLDNSEDYYVHIPSGAIEDLASNAFTGLTGTAWSFTTISGYSGVPTVAFEASYASTSDLTTYTFAACDLGTPAADRYIVVAVGARQGSGGSFSISSATINGVSAAVDASAADALGTNTHFLIAAVPSDATGDIVITFSGAQARCGISVYSVTNLQSATPVDTATSTQDTGTLNLDVDVAADGFAIGCVVTTDGNGLNHTWTGLTEVAEFQLETTIYMSHAYAAGLSAATPRTVNVVSTAGTPTNVAASAISFR